MVFIAPVMAEVDHKKWRAIRGKKITALGLQGFLKHAPRTDLSQKRLVVPTGDAFDKQLLDGVDAVFFSEEDMALFGPAGLLDDLLSTVNLVFMTRGEKGCSVFSNRGSFDVRTYQTNAIDPTGAGDTFAAAAALALAAGGSPRQAAGIGAAAASIVVEGMGGECLGRVENTLRRALELC
jgi:sugar/nucleoside kinase (ribokinase family)